MSFDLWTMTEQGEYNDIINEFENLDNNETEIPTSVDEAEVVLHIEEVGKSFLWGR